jgi:hypothetical protein
MVIMIAIINGRVGTGTGTVTGGFTRREDSHQWMVIMIAIINGRVGTGTGTVTGGFPRREDSH